MVYRVARCPVFDRTVRFFGDLSGQKYDAKPDNGTKQNLTQNTI